MASDIRAALEWLVNLHCGVSKGGLARIEADDGVAEVSVAPSGAEWTAALDEAREALEAYDEQARLRDAVVEAALAKRRAGRRLREGRNFETGVETDRAWNAALRAYEQAVDALLAFLGEGKDG